MNNLDKANYDYRDQQAEPASPFDRLTDAVGSLEDLLKRVTILSDRLAGPPPPQPVEGKGEIVGSGPGGLLAVVDRSASRVNGLRRAISDQIARIEEGL